MTLTFGQWVRLGFGGVALMRKHAAAIPLLRPLVSDLLDLWQSITPPDGGPLAGAVTHADVIDKLRTGNLSEDEKRILDRASRNVDGGG